MMGRGDFQGPLLGDLRVGMRCELGTYGFVEADMIAFATLYDPQDMHVDPLSASGLVGGLIASGWQTAAVAMRLLATAPAFGIYPILGIGVYELRWPKPVRPGDRIVGFAEIIEIRSSVSKPDRGTVRMLVTLKNQHDWTVLSMQPLLSVMNARRVGTGGEAAVASAQAESRIASSP